uniref:(California timema) hypothetical protein n=1 Tax=Timema californicum TaxID=61474 RepID=A0A7R9J1W7_TIMCA|nr:unnamed protein product [Timema californicum]
MARSKALAPSPVNHSYPLANALVVLSSTAEYGEIEARTNEQQDHERTIESLKQQYDSNIDTMKQEFDKNMETFKQNYELKIEEMKKSHEQKVRELEVRLDVARTEVRVKENEFNERLKDLENEKSEEHSITVVLYEEKMHSLTEQVSKLQATLKDVQDDYYDFRNRAGADISSYKKKTEQFEQKYRNELEKNSRLVAASQVNRSIKNRQNLPPRPRSPAPVRRPQSILKKTSAYTDSELKSLSFNRRNAVMCAPGDYNEQDSYEYNRMGHSHRGSHFDNRVTISERGPSNFSHNAQTISELQPDNHYDSRVIPELRPNDCFENRKTISERRPLIRFDNRETISELGSKLNFDNRATEQRATLHFDGRKNIYDPCFYSNSDKSETISNFVSTDNSNNMVINSEPGSTIRFDNRAMISELGLPYRFARANPNSNGRGNTTLTQYPDDVREVYDSHLDTKTSTDSAADSTAISSATPMSVSGAREEPMRVQDNKGVKPSLLATPKMFTDDENKAPIVPAVKKRKLFSGISPLDQE